MKSRKKLIVTYLGKSLFTCLALFSISSYAGRGGDISIVTPHGDLTFEVSHDEDFSSVHRVDLRQCVFSDALNNIGGGCHGAFGFKSNSAGKLYIRFYSQSQGNFFHSYRLASGQCYHFEWLPFGDGYDLRAGCPAF